MVPSCDWGKIARLTGAGCCCCCVAEPMTEAVMTAGVEPTLEVRLVAEEGGGTVGT